MTLAEACAESIWGPSRIPIKMWLSNAMQLLGEKANTIFRGQDVWKVINPPFFVMGYIKARSGGKSGACQGSGTWGRGTYGCCRVSEGAALGVHPPALGQGVGWD